MNTELMDAKLKWHKRHIVVDILLKLLLVKVRAANKSNAISACEALERVFEKNPSYSCLFGECRISRHLVR